jgi:hypothetical protein
MIITVYEIEVEKRGRVIGTAVVEAGNIYAAMAQVRREFLRDGLGHVTCGFSRELYSFNRVLGPTDPIVVHFTSHEGAKP